MQRLEFTKYEGLGNDFILIDNAAHLTPAHASALCDRRRGIGADGILFVTHDGTRARMRVMNADGSEPEMCGNGIRCVALHLLRKRDVAALEIDIDTASGPHHCVARITHASHEADVEVQMRVPLLSPADIPVNASQPLIDHPLEVQGTLLHITAVSMGNPHAVIFDVLHEHIRQVLGPVLQRHPMFPAGANISFATMKDPETIELNVLERGSGWTLACGTGACATAVAAVETNRAKRNSELRIDLPGGRLNVQVGAATEPVRMRGPARLVFEGEILI
jgi:diaminopimelate epimerase